MADTSDVAKVLIEDVDSLTRRVLEAGVKQFQLEMGLFNFNHPEWQVRQARAMSLPDTYQVEILTWHGIVISGLAFVQDGRVVFYLDTRSIWLLVRVELDKRFENHDKDWPHLLGC